MADKDMTERQVLTKKLPNAEILLCLYHTLKSLRGEIANGQVRHISWGKKARSGDSQENGICSHGIGIPDIVSRDGGICTQVCNGVLYSQLA